MTPLEIAEATTSALRVRLLETTDDVEQVLIEAELDRREWPQDDPEDVIDADYNWEEL